MTCGGGSEVFTRSCDSPVPENVGAACVGDTSKTEGCAANSCPSIMKSRTKEVTIRLMKLKCSF